jgi:orotate phosphoribosyltransferase
MESKTLDVSLPKNPVISMKVIPGHFSTGNIHVSHYVDVHRMKSTVSVARDVGREMALPYLSSTIVNTIVCMERTVVIGAYLAQELLQPGTAVVNSGGEIHVISPLSNVDGKLIFQESSLGWISNQSIVLLVASVSSGRTVASALECLEYYGGRTVGISALFVASPGERKIHALFTADDIPGYKMYSPGECAMCKAGQKLDAIISSEGYTKIK